MTELRADAGSPRVDPSGTGRWRALRLPLAVGGAGLVAAALLHLRDPNVSGSYGYCPFQVITGWDCPGCGGLRAVHALTNFDVTTAVSSNVLAVLLVAALVVAGIAWIPRRMANPRARMIALSTRTGVALIAIAFVFTVIRNTPWGAWLHS